ncbi:MAG TPA: FAD-dependent oxidoreductase [Gemmatimonadales bacterium]|nr:FAD-dependent oxidoreductase [Gemmatimonadales bacterium]
MTSPTGHDTIVVGAGIVGAACAASLARRGRRVLVLEAGFAGGGTTAAGMGHLVAMDDSPEQLAFTAYSRRLWDAMASRLPASVEYERCGTIWVAEDDEQLAVVRAKQKTLADAGVASEVLDSKQLTDAEPCLRPGLPGGLLVPDDGVLYPPAAALHLLEQARSNGAVLRERCAVTAIAPHTVRTAEGDLSADLIVNAAGPHAPELTPDLLVIPRKGHLIITDRHPGFCRHQLVELGYLKSAHVMTTESVAFNLQPRATGQVMIGSSRELVGWIPGINQYLVRRMLERAIEFAPGLGRMSALRIWTGYRPATPDKLPLIGPWDTDAGTWIATGHEGLGITTALATGEILADLVAGATPKVDPSPFHPRRAMAEISHA